MRLPLLEPSQDAGRATTVFTFHRAPQGKSRSQILTRCHFFSLATSTPSKSHKRNNPVLIFRISLPSTSALSLCVRICFFLIYLFPASTSGRSLSVRICLSLIYVCIFQFGSVFLFIPYLFIYLFDSRLFLPGCFSAFVPVKISALLHVSVCVSVPFL